MNYRALAVVLGIAVAMPPQTGYSFPGVKSSSSATSAPSVPDANVAFAPKLVADGRGWLLEYKILPGFYMYRDRFKISLGGQAVSLSWPPALQVQDPNFGEVAVYRNTLRVPLPAEAARAIAMRKPLQITAQGCSDGGFCYAPFEQTVRAAAKKP